MEQCLGQCKHKSLHPVPPLSCVVDSGQTIQVHSLVKITVNDKLHTYPPVQVSSWHLSMMSDTCR